MDDRISGGYVVIGGGVCGCLLAHELATRTGADVHLIESGGDQPENATDRSRPGRWLHLLGSTDDEAYQTEPTPTIAGRRMNWPRGRGLGGSGRINAMIWATPHRLDWTMLHDCGVSVDRLELASKIAQRRISTEFPRSLDEFSQRFITVMASQPELGRFAAYRRVNRNGRRWTTESLFTELQAKNPGAAARVRIVRGLVERLTIQGDRVGAFQMKGGGKQRAVSISPSTQVVSCAGSLGSPRLLMRSGIGHPGELRCLGIDPMIDLPGVGKSLHDHLVMPVVHQRSGQSFGAGPPTMSELAAWQHNGTGRLASNVAECGGFDPTNRFQWHVTPTDYLRYPSPSAGTAMTLGVSLTRPRSRGRVSLVPDDDDPTGFRLAIDPGYLTDALDIREMIEGIHKTRTIADRLNESGMHLVESIPGRRRQTDDQLVASVGRYCQTLYHPGGTCAMGSVVDSRFRVHGLSNLAIIDASVLPEPTMANPTSVLAALTCMAAAEWTATDLKPTDWYKA